MNIFSKILPASLCFLAISSCSNSDDSLMNFKNAPDSSKTSADIKLNKIFEFVNEAKEQIYGTSSRSTNSEIDISNVQYQLGFQSRGNDNDTLFYAINFKNNEGFALVSFSETEPELIAITEKGSYPFEKGQIGGLDQYIDNVISTLSERGIKDSIIVRPGTDFDDGDLVQYKTERIVLDDIKHEPDYTKCWGQRFPEGIYFANGSCGCTNTGMLIILSYFKYPSSIKLEFPEYSNEDLILNWDAINRHKVSGDYYYPYSDICESTTHQMIGKLCRQLGYLNNSVCKEDKQTTTLAEKPAQTFNKLGLNAIGLQPYDFNRIVNTLSNSGLILAHGKNSSTTNTYHVWVIDGYKYTKIWSGEYIKEPGKDWVLINDHGIKETQLVHVNWGYNGDMNGYFVSDQFNTTTATQYDNSNQHIIKEKYYNIKIDIVNR